MTQSEQWGELISHYEDRRRDHASKAASLNIPMMLGKDPGSPQRIAAMEWINEALRLDDRKWAALMARASGENALMWKLIHG